MKDGLFEETVKKNYLYRGKILSLRCDDALLPDGSPCKREIVEHAGGVGVLAVKDHKVALVRQFRYAYGEELLEIPAGKLEEGEDPVLGAKRELSEETGLEAERLKLLATLYPSPGYTDEIIYIYEAIGVKEGKQHLDKGEFLRVEYVPLEEAFLLVENGTIRDGKTLVALLKKKNG